MAEASEASEAAEVAKAAEATEAAACTALGPATSDAPASARQDNMPHAKPRPKPLTQASIASASPRLQPEPVFDYEAGREAKARPDDDRSL